MYKEFFKKYLFPNLTDKECSKAEKIKELFENSLIIWTKHIKNQECESIMIFGSHLTQSLSSILLELFQEKKLENKFKKEDLEIFFIDYSQKIISKLPELKNRLADDKRCKLLNSFFEILINFIISLDRLIIDAKEESISNLIDASLLYLSNDLILNSGKMIELIIQLINGYQKKNLNKLLSKISNILINSICLITTKVKSLPKFENFNISNILSIINWAFSLKLSENLVPDDSKGFQNLFMSLINLMDAKLVLPDLNVSKFKGFLCGVINIFNKLKFVKESLNQIEDFTKNIQKDDILSLKLSGFQCYSNLTALFFSQEITGFLKKEDYQTLGFEQFVSMINKTFYHLDYLSRNEPKLAIDYERSYSFFIKTLAIELNKLNTNFRLPEYQELRNRKKFKVFLVLSISSIIDFMDGYNGPNTSQSTSFEVIMMKVVGSLISISYLQGEDEFRLWVPVKQSLATLLKKKISKILNKSLQTSISEDLDVLLNNLLFFSQRDSKLLSCPREDLEEIDGFNIYCDLLSSLLPLRVNNLLSATNYDIADSSTMNFFLKMENKLIKLLGKYLINISCKEKVIKWLKKEDGVRNLFPHFASLLDQVHYRYRLKVAVVKDWSYLQTCMEKVYGSEVYERISIFFHILFASSPKLSSKFESLMFQSHLNLFSFVKESVVSQAKKKLDEFIKSESNVSSNHIQNEKSRAKKTITQSCKREFVFLFECHFLEASILFQSFRSDFRGKNHQLISSHLNDAIVCLKSMCIHGSLKYDKNVVEAVEKLDPTDIIQFYLLLQAYGRIEDQRLVLDILTTNHEHFPDINVISFALQNIEPLYMIGLFFRGITNQVDKELFQSYFCEETKKKLKNRPKKEMFWIEIITSCIVLLNRESFLELYKDMAELITPYYLNEALNFLDKHPDFLDDFDIRSWLKLCISKVMFLYFYDPYSSYKVASGVLANSLSLTGFKDLNCSFLEIEGFLILIDILDYNGNYESAFGYISEASEIAALIGTQATSNLVSFHTLRVWRRAYSAKAVVFIDELNNIDDYSFEENKDEVTKRIRSIVGLLNQSFGLSDESHGSISRIFEDNKLDSATLELFKTKTSDFRYIFISWGLSLGFNHLLNDDEAKKSNLREERILYYSTLSPQYMINGLEILLESANFQFEKKSLFLSSMSTTAKQVDFSSYFFSKENRSVPKAFLEMGNLSFEMLKDFRRLALIQNLEQMDPKSSFVLGASSCNSSIEKLLEKDEKNLYFQTEEGNKSISQVINRGYLLGHETDASHIETELIKVFKSSTQEPCDNVANSLAFICLEKKSNYLIIGRRDESHQFVTALPFGNKLVHFKDKWEYLQEECKDQLRLTKDLDQVKKMSADDKNHWWDQRITIDKKIKSFLLEFEDLLGPWKILLGSQKICFEISIDLVGNEYKDFILKYKEWLELILSCLELNRQNSGEKLSEKKENSDFNLSSPSSESGFSRKCALSLIASIYKKKDYRELSKEELRFSLEKASLILDEARKNSRHQFDDEAITDENVDKTNQKSPDYQILKITELRKILKDLNLSTVGKKSELISRIKESHSSSFSSISASKSSSDISPELKSFGHAVLVVDEFFQSIPMESMPFLRRLSISRVPCLALLLNILYRHNKRKDLIPGNQLYLQTESKNKRNESFSKVDEETGKAHSDTCRLLSISKCWYAIDIENNLKETREQIEPFIQNYSRKWNWKGSVSKVPSEGEFRNFIESSDLYIYCGHGAGEKICDSFKVRKFNSVSGSLLWGCSSGKLSKHGVFDPSGPALSYLLGGAPFLIGNLWDVTDKDIDKLSMKCMENYFDSIQKNKKPCNLSESLSLSRSNCKLEGAVGYAPVMYGIPIGVKNS